MDKELELDIFLAVFGKDHSYRVMEHEQPDFLVMEGDKVRLGVEVTEIFAHETDAKLKNLEGYSLGLIEGTLNVHRRDKEYIKVEEATLQDQEGNEKGKFMGIFQEMPSFKDAVTILEESVSNKENKAATYLRACPSVDLIVGDASHLFRHEHFEDFYRPFYALHNKDKFMKSLFREVYLVTTKMDNSKVFVPLRGNMFLSDCFAYEMFLKEDGITKLSPKIAIESLLAALHMSGYITIAVSSNNNEFGVHFGPWELSYSTNGKNIRDRTLLFENTEVEMLAELFKEFSRDAIDQAKKMIKKRKEVFSAMEFSLPIKWHNKANPADAPKARAAD